MSDINLLTEASRQELLNKSKSSAKGSQRFSKRNLSKISTLFRDYNSLDMDSLFKNGICSVNIRVNGETDQYIVNIKFGGFLDLLHAEMKRNNGLCNLKVITRALINGFNEDDVFVSCSCPDYRFRFSYFASKNNFNSGRDETRPSNITNPTDSLGSACKHVLLVLNNNAWIIKVGTVIWNYIQYMGKHRESMYAKIIYPAIYEKEYNKSYQLRLDDKDKLDDEDDVKRSLQHKGRDERGRFTSGNDYQYAKKEPESELDDNPDQLSLQR